MAALGMTAVTYGVYNLVMMLLGAHGFKLANAAGVLLGIVSDVAVAGGDVLGEGQARPHSEEGSAQAC